jgi:Family of unknown function (DUF5343)
VATDAGYPKVSSKAWGVLRARASSAPSTKFTPSTVATLLDMASEQSARANVISGFRRIGLIDDDGALTDRGNRWRNDASYSDACQEIVEEVYPADLAAFTTAEGAPDKTQISTWFQHKGFGGSNATQMAATYALIAEKELPDVSKGDNKKVATKPRASRQKTRKSAVSPTASHEQPVVTSAPASQPTQAGSGPNVHLDIQIHIPANASLEQIDQIFASMSKHLYQR